MLEAWREAWSEAAYGRMRLQHCKDYPVRALAAEAHRGVVVADNVAQHDQRGAQHLDAAKVRQDGRKHGGHAAFSHKRRHVRWLARNIYKQIERRQQELVGFIDGDDEAEGLGPS